MRNVIASCAMLLLAAGSASGQTEKTPGQELAETVFGSIEAETDGRIDLGQFVVFGRSIFTAMDQNEDSKVDFVEFQSFDFGFDGIARESDKEHAYETAQKIVFAFWDRDGDQKIDRTEYQTAMTWDFQRADVDNDAFLTMDEFLIGYIINRAYRAALTGN